MLLNCACILVRVLEKTGFHYFIFHREPLHWDGHGPGLGLDSVWPWPGLECSGLVNITGRQSSTSTLVWTRLHRPTDYWVLYCVRSSGLSYYRPTLDWMQRVHKVHNKRWISRSRH